MSREKINRRSALKKSGLLIGGTLSVSALMTMMAGCEVPMDPDWAPTFFSEDEAETLGHLAETIIPRTDTPGALDAKVHRYLDVMAGEVFTEEQTAKFQAGLTSFMKDCKDNFGGSFASLADDKKQAALSAAAEIKGDDGPSFFNSLRSMVIAGFFTSEVGAKEVLKYDPIPGAYDPCIPLSEVGGTWAL